MFGYNIGCGFSTTVNNSRLLGPKLCEKKCRFCINAFHGHAHCRTCQMKWHPLYTVGTGLEDFEGCKCLFSESNKVAECTQHTSVFHQRQAILCHFKRWNKDKIAECSRFIYNNYVQALANISNLEPKLASLMKALNIESSEVFERWHAEEAAYLVAMKEAPKIDHLAIEYVTTLKKLDAAQ